MAIVTRLGKGSKLTAEEMDNNLLSLESDILGNVSAITSKLDKGTYTGTAKDLENAIAASVSAITSKLDKGSYTGTAKDLENAIIAASTGASGISIVPTSPAPSGTGIASFTATQAGTYTNYGGVVVAANSFAIISRSAAGVFSISQTALDLTSYAKKKSLEKVAIQNKNINAQNVLLNKFRTYHLDYDNWTWTDASATVGIKPTAGNKPIWATTTDGFIDATITDLDKGTAKHMGVIFEANVLLNQANFTSADCYFQTDGTYRGFTSIKKLLVGNRHIFYGKFDLATLPAYTTLKFVMASHTTNSGVSVVCEFSNVRLFYIEETIVDGLFTLGDITEKNTNDILTNAALLPRVTTLEENKLDKVQSNNLLNPSTFRYNNFYYSGQGSSIATGNGFGCTDYIPANVNGLITTGAGLSAGGLSSFAVFNSSKVWLRNGQNSNQYTYVAGDGYVVFVYNQVNAGFADTKAVNIGSTVLPFSQYSTYEPLLLLDKRVSTLETNGVSVIGVKNGTSIVYGNVSNFTGGAISNRDVVNDSLVFNRVGTGNSWILSPVFIPKGSNLVNITFTVEFTKVGTTKGIQIIVAQQVSVGGKYFSVGSPIRENGTYTITVDPAYYNVYEGFTNFYIWINNESILAGESFTAKLTGLKVLEYENAVKGANILGLNSKELFESADKALTSIKGQLTDKASLVSPLGNKFELNVSNTGVITAIPIVPNKGAFVGNSLIGGFSNYGMAASEAQYDYYNRINTYINSINPSYTSKKVSESGFEAADTEAKLVTAINTMVALFDGDENLVSIQLGDNVNTTERNTVFNGGGCLRLLQAIRTKCPNARVVFMGMWYATAERYTTIENSCASTGSKFISYVGLSTTASQNKIGNITKRGTGTRTLIGVTNVVVNTATNITVTFTVASVSYVTTLTVTSHSLSSGTLTYSGEFEIISNSGVASHPNDEGFRLISNMFLYEMKLTTDINYYK
jgi:hypothetical protein